MENGDYDNDDGDGYLLFFSVDNNIAIDHSSPRLLD